MKEVRVLIMYNVYAHLRSFMLVRHAAESVGAGGGSGICANIISEIHIHKNRVHRNGRVKISCMMRV